MLPLQAQRSEGPARGLLALGAEDEVSSHLVLHRWPGERERDFYVSLEGPMTLTFEAFPRGPFLMSPVSSSS